MKRTILALLIAPLWAPLLAVSFSSLIFPSPDEIIGDMTPGEKTLMAATIGAGLGYAAMLVIGVPVHMVLRRWNQASIFAYLGLWTLLTLIFWAGFHIAGFIAAGPGFALSYLLETVIERTAVPLRFALAGALVGATFWTIARPDRKTDVQQPA